MKITRLPKRKGVLAVELALFASLIAFVTQPFVQPVKSSPSAADPAQLERDVRKLSVDFLPRHYQSPSLEKTARYIEERLTAMGGRVSSQPVPFMLNRSVRPGRFV